MMSPLQPDHVYGSDNYRSTIVILFGSKWDLRLSKISLRVLSFTESGANRSRNVEYSVAPTTLKKVAILACLLSLNLQRSIVPLFQDIQ